MNTTRSNSLQDRKIAASKRRENYKARKLDCKTINRKRENTCRSLVQHHQPFLQLCCELFEQKSVKKTLVSFKKLFSSLSLRFGKLESIIIIYQVDKEHEMITCTWSTGPFEGSLLRCTTIPTSHLFIKCALPLISYRLGASPLHPWSCQNVNFTS